MQAFVSKLLHEAPEVPNLRSDGKDWASENVVQRMAAHAKRIQILYNVKLIAEQYFKERKEAMESLNKEL